MGQNAIGGGEAGEQDLVWTMRNYENNKTHTTLSFSYDKK
jgi:hypothetical protein